MFAIILLVSPNAVFGAGKVLDNKLSQILSKSGEKYFVLELNARQGRSCDYIRASGINIAKRLLSCLGVIEDGEAPSYKSAFWHYPPKRTALKYMNEFDKIEAKSFSLDKKRESAIVYRRDLRFNPKRAFYVMIHGVRLGRKYKRDFGGR